MKKLFISSTQKILIGIVVFFLVGGFMLSAPRPAQAFLGIGDISFDPTVWMETVWEFAQTTAKWIADQMYPVLRDAVVKRIVDDMTDQIINSIENGGTPLFVTDPSAYFKKATDLTFDTFNNVLTSQAGLDLCAPFQSQLTLYFYNNIAGANRYPLGIPTHCTFDQFKQNIQNSETFIQSGGWVGLQELFLPQNNLIGASISLESSYYSSIAAKQDIQKQEYQAGQGFLSVKQCTQYESPLSGQLVDEAQFQTDATQACNDAGRTDVDQCVSEFADAYCRQQQTKTPGDIVAQSASQATLKDFPYAENVQSILSALVNVFIKNVFDKGKGLIFASTSHGSSLAANTLNYSGSTPGGNPLENSWNNAQRTINNIDVNYAHIQDLLNGDLIPKVQQGRTDAINAIYFCYMTISGSYDSNPYGWLVYTLGNNNLKYQSSLFSLVDTPISSSTPPVGYELPGEPTELSLLKPTYSLGSVGIGGRTFPPPISTSTPFQEGYFDRTLRDMKAAQAELIQNRAGIIAFKNQLNSISTSTTVTSTQMINGSPEEVSVDNVASSTTALSNLTNNANSQYNDFIQRYKPYVSDAIDSEQSGTGPGTLGGGTGSMSDILSAVDDGLVHPDEMSMPHGNNFYYCEFRK